MKRVETVIVCDCCGFQRGDLASKTGLGKTSTRRHCHSHKIFKVMFKYTILNLVLILYKNSDGTSYLQFFNIVIVILITIIE